MKCHACEIGECQPGTTSELLERGEMSVVVRGVPALVCGNCGEAYFSTEVTRRLLSIAEDALSQGKEIVLEHYRAA